MSRNYLIFKCCKDQKRKAIVCLTAFNHDEAHEAFQWMQKHHPDNENYKLGIGEFIEVVDESHVEPEEWRKAVESLNRGK